MEQKEGMLIVEYKVRFLTLVRFASAVWLVRESGTLSLSKDFISVSVPWLP